MTWCACGRRRHGPPPSSSLSRHWARVVRRLMALIRLRRCFHEAGEILKILYEMVPCLQDGLRRKAKAAALRRGDKK